MKRAVVSFLSAHPDIWEYRAAMLLMLWALAHYAPLWVAGVCFSGSILLGLFAYLVASVIRDVGKIRGERRGRV